MGLPGSCSGANRRLRCQFVSGEAYMSVVWTHSIYNTQCQAVAAYRVRLSPQNSRMLRLCTGIVSGLLCWWITFSARQVACMCILHESVRSAVVYQGHAAHVSTCCMHDGMACMQRLVMKGSLLPRCRLCSAACSTCPTWLLRQARVATWCWVQRQ